MLHLLSRARLAWDQVFLREIGEAHITAGQYTVLVVLSKEDGIGQTEIVARTGIDRSTISDIVKRLVQRGLLRRRRKAGDARAFSVKLTDEGRRQLALTEPAARRAEEAVLKVLPTKERVRFRQDLLHILSALGN